MKISRPSLGLRHVDQATACDHRKMRSASLALAFVLTGCVGDIGSGVPDGVDPNGPGSDLACTADTPGSSPMRRLTRWEYNNTVLDLLGDATRPADKLDSEGSSFGFDNNVDAALLNVSVIEGYESVSIDVARRATADLEGLLGCDVATAGEEACANDFVVAFGRKAFRRPLTPDEIDAYQTFVGQNLGESGLAETIQMVISAMLQSSSFLYRVEALGPAGTDDVVPLSSHEMATRLSYLVWGTMPDDVLFDAADRGELATPEQVAAQARRMLDHDMGKRAFVSFVSQWSSMTALTKEQRGPDFTPEIAALMNEELTTFADEVLRKGDGKLATFFTAPYSYMNKTLADYYGIAGPTGDELVKVDLDPTRYAGMLTQGGLMALKAHDEQHSTVRRGTFILEKLLCSPTPPPPCDADLTLPEVDPNTTSRQRLETKTSVSPCVNCHAIINPAGYAFEHFDQNGRWHEDENGLTIDTTGVISATGKNVAFTGPVDLAEAIADSELARACFVDHWFRYAYGRNFADADQCVREDLTAAFESSEGNVRELVVALTQTPTFLYRQGGAQ